MSSSFFHSKPLSFDLFSLWHFYGLSCGAGFHRNRWCGHVIHNKWPLGLLLTWTHMTSRFLLDRINWHTVHFSDNRVILTVYLRCYSIHQAILLLSEKRNPNDSFNMCNSTETLESHETIRCISNKLFGLGPNEAFI